MQWGSGKKLDFHIQYVLHASHLFDPVVPAVDEFLLAHAAVLRNKRTKLSFYAYLCFHVDSPR